MKNFFTSNANLWGDDIPWLCGIREKGSRTFAKLGLPNIKTEAWKYSFLPSVEFDNLEMTSDEECSECSCHNHDDSPSDAYVIDFCNGCFHGCSENLPEGLEIKPLIEAIADKEAQKYLNKSFDMENFPFAALNTAYLENGAMITISRNTELDKPICLHCHTHRKNCLANIRNIIVLERGAKAVLTEKYSGEGNYFANIVNEHFIGVEAQLKHYIEVREASSAKHIALNSVLVKKDASYISLISHGECRLSRSESFICLQDEGAKTQVDGMYILKNDGVSDITTNVKHLAAHTYSDQLVKGVVDGRAKGVFQGQIHIAPSAVQTEGNQLHRAILLSDAAEVDCKPELEIFADDVKCSHGAVCGDLDKEQLFYMQSRGIALEDAKQILIDAYFNEISARNPWAKNSDK